MYTSYFANIKKLPDNVVPIAISRKIPKKYTGLQYKKLAPRQNILTEWKETNDDISYITAYQEQILDKLSAKEVVKELENLSKTSIDMVCLVCYERSNDFCHRHLVASWFKENGYDCQEFHK